MRRRLGGVVRHGHQHLASGNCRLRVHRRPALGALRNHVRAKGHRRRLRPAGDAVLWRTDLRPWPNCGRYHRRTGDVTWSACNDTSVRRVRTIEGTSHDLFSPAVRLCGKRPRSFALARRVVSLVKQDQWTVAALSKPRRVVQVLHLALARPRRDRRALRTLRRRPRRVRERLHLEQAARRIVEKS